MWGSRFRDKTGELGEKEGESGSSSLGESGSLPSSTSFATKLASSRAGSLRSSSDSVSAVRSRGCANDPW
jgi:hypothetical protein